MKKTIRKISTAEVLLRLTVGTFLILAGIAIIVLHLLKVVPADWLTCTCGLSTAIGLIWAYSGWILGGIVLFYGLWVTKILQHLIRLIVRKGLI